MGKIFTVIVALFSVLFGIGQGNPLEIHTDHHIPLNGNEVGMIPFRAGAKYGFVAPNNPEKVLIDPTFDAVLAVHSNGAIVAGANGYGLVTASGEIVIPLAFERLAKEGGLFHGSNPGPVGEGKYLHSYFSLDGELIFSQAADNEASFGVNNYAWFQYQEAIIVKNTAGFAVSRFPLMKQTFCLGIHNDYTCFRRKLRDTSFYAGYTYEGELAFEIPVNAIPWFRGGIRLADDFFMFESSPNNRVFANKKGEFRPYRARFSGNELQESVLARGSIRVGDVKAGVMGVVNLKGDTLIPFIYDKIYSKVNQYYLAIEKKSKNMVVLDEAGRKLAEFDVSISDFIQQHQVLNEAVGFYDGLALQRKPVLRGQELAATFLNKDSTVYYFSYFDSAGKEIIRLNPKFTFAGNFSDGLAAIADMDGNLGFINTSGEWVIQPNLIFNPPKYWLHEPAEIPRFKGGFAYIPSAKGYIDKQGRKYYVD